MTTETLKILVDTQVKGINDVKKLKTNLNDVGKAGKEAAPGIERSSKATGGLNTSIKGLVAGGALLAAGNMLLDFGKASIAAASDVQEMQSKFDTVFKDLGGEVTAELQTFAGAANRSVFDLQGFAATLQDTFVPLGFARDEAAGMSVEIVKLAEDLASFNNLNTADVVADLQSALVGNTETLRKYGVVANQAAIDQEALALGYEFTKGQMDAQTKAAAILSLTMKGTTDAQGDAIKTSDSFANKMKGLEAATTELQVAFGEGLLPAATNVVTVLTSLVNVVGEAADMYNKLSSQQDKIVDTVMDGNDTWGDAVIILNELNKTVGINTWDSYAASITEARVAARRMNERLEELGVSTEGLTEAQITQAARSAEMSEYYQAQADAIEDVTDAQEEYVDFALQSIDTQDAYNQAMLEGYAALEQYETKQENTASAIAATEAAQMRWQQQMITGVGITSELKTGMEELTGQAGHIAGAFNELTGTVDRSALALEKVLGYMNTLDGRTADMSVNVSVSGLDQAERAAAIANQLGDAGGDVKGNSAGGSKGQGGAGSSSGFDPEGPKFASGTGGWLTVPPGFPNDSYQINLTSGEPFYVGKPGESIPSGDININIAAVYQQPGQDTRAFAQATSDRLMSALRSRGVA